MTTSKEPVLWHYTSLESFRNIVKNGTIRATHYQQLNDQSELKKACDELHERLDECSKKHKNDKRITHITEQSKGLLKAVKDWQCFIFSLSNSSPENSLSQWRAYTPQDGGVAIGFSRDCLENKLCGTTAEHGQIKLHQCLYEPLGDLDEKKLIDGYGFTDIISSVRFLFEQICAIKHKAYEDEAEWRLVFFNVPPGNRPFQLNERDRKFVEFQFDPLDFIKEIWISPHGNQRRIKSVIEFLIQEKRLSIEPHEICESNIPFRTSHY